MIRKDIVCYNVTECRSTIVAFTEVSQSNDIDLKDNTDTRMHRLLCQKLHHHDHQMSIAMVSRQLYSGSPGGGGSSLAVP